MNDSFSETSTSISVVPDGHLLVDDELHIKVCGLEPGQKVTVYVHLEEEGSRFESWSWFMVDQSGFVDLYNQGSVFGTYTGISPMGIFWSLEPEPGQRKGIRITKKKLNHPLRCQVYVHQGHVTADDIRSRETKCVCTRCIERWYKAPGVTSEDVRSGRVRGRLYLPPGDGPFQGLIDMFGLSGGLTDFRSCLLASRGFASLALPYFAYDDLPADLHDIDLDYFQEALEWLLAHEKVCSKGIGVVGVSKGGEIGLLMGAHMPKVHAIVNINGFTNIGVYPLKFQGRVFPAEEFNYAKMVEVEENVCYTKDTVVYTAAGLIPVWNNNPKILHICSEDDMSIPPESVQLLEEHYPADKKENLIVVRYPGAGHLVEPPYTPLCRMSYTKIYGSYILWGGRPKPHAAAQEDAWRRILKFLRDNIPVDSTEVVTSKL